MPSCFARRISSRYSAIVNARRVQSPKNNHGRPAYAPLVN
jgi:hypothetical protein